MRLNETISWMNDIVIAAFTAPKVRRVRDLTEDIAYDMALTSEQKKRGHELIAKLQAEIKAETDWLPAASELEEMRRLEEESQSYDRAMGAANMALLNDIVSKPQFGVPWKPENDDAWQARSLKAGEKFNALCEKHKIPVRGLEDLRRWNLLHPYTGRYQGRVKTGLAAIR